MRKLSLLILAVALLLPACRKGSEVKELRIALQPFPLYGPIFVVKQNRWLEEELGKKGITVKWSSFPSGPPENESFSAGEQDIGVMGDSPAIIARSSGVDTRVIGVSATAPAGLAVVVPKDSPITSPADLKGKKVAVVKGSYAHHLLSLVLEKSGLGAGDIQMINLPLADIGSALAKKEIDAGAIWEPLITKLEDDGVTRTLADGTGIKKGALIIIAMNDFARKNPELIEAFLKAYQRGYEYIKSNPAGAAELVSRDVNLPPEQIRKIMAKFDYNPALGPDLVEELKKTERFMRQAGITRNEVNIDSFVSTQYLERAGIR